MTVGPKRTKNKKTFLRGNGPSLDGASKPYMATSGGGFKAGGGLGFGYAGSAMGGRSK